MSLMMMMMMMMMHCLTWLDCISVLVAGPIHFCIVFAQVHEQRHGQLKKSGKKRIGSRDDGTFVRRSAGSSRRQHPFRIVWITTASVYSVTQHFDVLSVTNRSNKAGIKLVWRPSWSWLESFCKQTESSIHPTKAVVDIADFPRVRSSQWVFRSLSMSKIWKHDKMWTT